MARPIDWFEELTARELLSSERWILQIFES